MSGKHSTFQVGARKRSLGTTLGPSSCSLVLACGLLLSCNVGAGSPSTGDVDADWPSAVPVRGVVAFKEFQDDEWHAWVHLLPDDASCDELTAVDQRGVDANVRQRYGVDDANETYAEIPTMYTFGNGENTVLTGEYVRDNSSRDEFRLYVPLDCAADDCSGGSVWEAVSGSVVLTEEVGDLSGNWDVTLVKEMGAPSVSTGTFEAPICDYAGAPPEPPGCAAPFDVWCAGDTVEICLDSCLAGGESTETECIVEAACDATEDAAAVYACLEEPGMTPADCLDASECSAAC